MEGASQLDQAKLHIAKNLALPLDAITQKFAFLGRSGAGKTYGAGKFVEELLDAGAQVVILDPIGNWYGLRLAADGKSPGIPIPIFGGDRGDIPLLHTGGALVADLVVDKGISVVLDVHHFRKHERKDFMTQFAEQLFHRKKSSRSPMHVVIEEAQVFVPQKAFKGEERLLGAMEDLCKLGRNYGIGNTLISQRPQAVNKDVLNQTGTLFVFNMTGPQERKVMEGWIVEQGVDMTEVVKDLPSLPNGTAYVWSPQWLGKFEKVQIGEKRTYDASATPVFGKVEKARALAPVDLAQIQEAMQSRIEKAKENDPKELHRKIRELRAELKTANSFTSTGKRKIEDRAEVIKLKAELREREKQWGEAFKAQNFIIVNLQKRLLQIAHLAAATGSPQPLNAPQALPPTEHHKKVISPVVSPPPRRPRANSHDPAAESGDPKLAGGQRKILKVLAHYPEGKPKVQVAILAGYGHRGGGFNNYLGGLRSAGYIQGDPDRLSITDAGLVALGDFEQLPTGVDLQNYWKSRLGGAQLAIFNYLVDHPGPVSKEDLAQATGYEATGGGFNNALGRLRMLELIQGRREVQASDVLFEEVR